MLNDLSKIEIAQIQLNAAITGLFSGAHLVVVHTLSSAASRILSDLVDVASKKEAWHTMAINANNLSSKEYFGVIRATSNDIKHADRDPHAMVSLEPQDVELLLWIATYDLGVLKSSSPESEIYQLWCIARHAAIFKHDEMGPVVAASCALFGDLAKASRLEALAAGRKELQNIRSLNDAVGPLTDTAPR